MMVFNPEDKQNFGPHCRNCHKGSSRCATCHNPGGAVTTDLLRASNNALGWSSDPKNASTYTMAQTSDAQANPIGARTDLVDNELYKFVTGKDANGDPTYSGGAAIQGFFKKSRTVDWDDNWRTSGEAVEMGKILAGGIEADCADDGFSWPHRTLGWKMLKDDLFGLDFTGSNWVEVGQDRTYTTPGGTQLTFKVHDLDSVCLDCHNPTVWNATGPSHIDKPGAANAHDDHNDELLTRGLP